MKTDITFIQFLHPNAAKREQVITLDDPQSAFARKQMEIISSECRLTAEILSTGHCSFCIEHEQGDFACEICPNGPEVIPTIERLLLKFDLKKLNEWRKEMEEA